jgi:hypothetical protein
MNSLRLSPLQHAVSMVFAVLIASVLFGGVAATAQQRGGPQYTATLVAPTTETRPIIDSTVWSCSGTTCSGPRGTSRPAIVCARLVREVGAVSAFVARGEAMTAEQLARCNAAAT